MLAFALNQSIGQYSKGPKVENRTGPQLQIKEKVIETSIGDSLEFKVVDFRTSSDSLYSFSKK